VDEAVQRFAEGDPRVERRFGPAAGDAELGEGSFDREEKTGKTPRPFLQRALDRGPGRATVPIILHGETIDPKPVGSGGTPSAPSDRLALDGKASRRS